MGLANVFWQDPPNERPHELGGGERLLRQLLVEEYAELSDRRAIFKLCAERRAPL